MAHGFKYNPSWVTVRKERERDCFFFCTQSRTPAHRIVVVSPMFRIDPLTNNSTRSSLTDMPRGLSTRRV